MDRLRKSVVERHMSFLTVIHSANGFALACFYGFLIGLILITTIWKIINQDHLLPQKMVVAEKKKSYVSVNGLF
jgi:hypothetical protein